MKARVKLQKDKEIEIKVLLSLIKLIWLSLAILFLLA